MVAQATRNLVHRVDGNYTLGANTYAQLTDKFGTVFTYSNVVNNGSSVDFYIPGSALNTATLPGTLVLVINGTTVRSKVLAVSSEIVSAQNASATFGSLYTGNNFATRSDVTVQVTQGTYPGYIGDGGAVPYSGIPDTNIMYNGKMTPFPDDNSLGCIATVGIGPGVSYKPIDFEYVVAGSTYAAILVWGSGFVNPEQARVYVDDIEVAGGPFNLVAGTENTITLTLPDTGQHRIRFSGFLLFKSIAFNGGTGFFSPYPRKTFGVVSDSYYEGMGFNYGDVQPIFLRTLTGWRVWNMAEGGTGWINPATGIARPFGHPTRMNLLYNAPIDALIVNGSGNDLQYNASQQVRENMRQFYQDVYRMRPTLPIIQILTQDLAAFNNVYDTGALNAAQRAEAEAAPNVVGIISPWEENFFTGNGYQGNTTGSGNQDAYIGPDALHLTPAGARYLATLTANRIARFRTTP